MILMFLGSWRSTLIVLISIPLSILTSIVVLYFMGHTLNTMTLGGHGTRGREVIPATERDLIVDDIGVPQRAYNLAFTDGSTINVNDHVRIGIGGCDGGRQRVVRPGCARRQCQRPNDRRPVADSD